MAAVRQTQLGHQCPDCERRYKYRNNLISHRRNECGKNPFYQCHLCRRAYRFKGSLTKHLKRAHDY